MNLFFLLELEGGEEAPYSVSLGGQENLDRMQEGPLRSRVEPESMFLLNS